LEGKTRQETGNKHKAPSQHPRTTSPMPQPVTRKAAQSVLACMRKHEPDPSSEIVERSFQSAAGVRVKRGSNLAVTGNFHIQQVNTGNEIGMPNPSTTMPSSDPTSACSEVRLDAFRVRGAMKQQAPSVQRPAHPPLPSSPSLPCRWTPVVRALPDYRGHSVSDGPPACRKGRNPLPIIHPSCP
jgi:hypothetical protein